MQIWIPDRTIIPPSPPAERRIKRQQEWDKDTQPIICPGLNPAAWREWEKMRAMPFMIDPSKFVAATSGPSVAPTASWRLEDTSDSVGSLTLTNNGTTTFGTGKIGNSAIFNGSNQSLSRTSTAALIPTGAFSFGGWIYPTTDTASLFAVLFKGTSVGTTTFCYRVTFFGGAGNRYLRFWQPQAGLTIFNVSSANGSITLNAWNCFVVGYDAAGGGAQKIYVQINNGSLVQAAGPSPGSLSTSTGDFYIGQEKDPGSQSWWAGNIDALVYFGTQWLSSGDRTAFYNGGTGTEYYSGAWH